MLLAQADSPHRGQHLAVRSTLLAEPTGKTPLMIRVVPADVGPGKLLRLSGLPPAATLSVGHVIAPGDWAVPLNGLPSLTLTLPASLSGKTEFVVRLFSEDGRLLDEARIALVIQPPAGAPQSKAPAKDAESPPPLASAPPLSAAERARAEKLVARGDHELELGNIAQARQFYQRAAQMGLAHGALMLGTTYDARELARLRAVGVVPNPAEALRWYQRALELGAPEARERLATLAGAG
jgi:Sel1 repeat-containing protein